CFSLPLHPYSSPLSQSHSSIRAIWSPIAGYRLLEDDQSLTWLTENPISPTISLFPPTFPTRIVLLTKVVWSSCCSVRRSIEGASRTPNSYLDAPYLAAETMAGTVD
ncbi:hypothetical protein LINGRAHAP2_LOCUS35177, partial [Linum grandiflorum]